MQRYRESGDVGDILRALAQARRSKVLQPQNSAAADEVAASAETALHRFKDALRYETEAHLDQPDDSNALSQMASLSMELGHYGPVPRDLDLAKRIQSTPTATILSIQARYDELTGSLSEAHRLLEEAIAQSDNVIDNPAQSRSWYHFRLGEIAFSMGATDEAKQDERDAIAEFPNDAMAYKDLARFCWATKDWKCALDAADNGAAVIPFAETLGYKADAQAALGDPQGAKSTQELIFAIEKIGNAYHISDRLLSVYYSEHGVRLDDSYKIAQREVLTRGDEIYAQDTLAWAAAMDGKWSVAKRAADRAIRYDTRDPRIQFHVGMIYLHSGLRDLARKHLQEALALNPQFDPFQADQARAALANLT
ncbi:MAG: hypothetical protein ABI182_08380 [Candidatus Baltobacteraceae bacterium]